MNEQTARDVVRAAIAAVAPDVDPEDLVGTARLRQDLELDSLDFLRVLETIVQNRPRLVRSPLGRDVCSEAAWVLERAKEGPGARRPWWKQLRDWLTP